MILQKSFKYAVYEETFIIIIINFKNSCVWKPWQFSMTLCLIEREHEKTGLAFVKQNLLDLLLLNKIFYNITILIIQGFSVTFDQFNVFLQNKSMFY